MAQEPTASRAWHLGGLLLAAGLCAACGGLYLYIPLWLRGTPLQGLGNLVTFLSVIASLSLAERLWAHLRAGLHKDAG
jgi:hypothetical protein